MRREDARESAWRRGYAAGCNRQRCEGNPYVEGSGFHAAWQDGWQKAVLSGLDRGRRLRRPMPKAVRPDPDRPAALL